MNTIVKVKDYARNHNILDEVYKNVRYNPFTGHFIRKDYGSRGLIAGEKRNGKNYWSVTIGKTRYLAHRLAWFYMTGEWPANQVDHINTVKSDNRWINLRMASHGQNKSNGRIYKNNSVGLKGVSKAPNKSGRFRARIRKDGKEYQIGTFDTLEEAHKAYVIAATEMHGDFARAG